jgi:micrococcal nuclease
VLAVLDGDTLGCDVDGNGRLNGKGERIRLLGIDAPETRHSPKNKTGQDEPGAQAAKQQLTQWALHQHVLLTFDKQHRDRYQRRLAYVYRLHPDTGTVETQSLNEKMIRQGLVRLLFIPPNRQLKALFQQAQREAAKPAPLPPASQDDRPG